VSIRFLILAGPEIPGHLTGQTLRSLYEGGIDSDTKRIIDAKGAIPYIENVPLEAVERFRKQVTLVDMLNNLDVQEIALMAEQLNQKNPGAFPEPEIWVEFKAKSKRKRPIITGAGIDILPEYGVTYNPLTSLVSGKAAGAVVSIHPSSVVITVSSGDEEGHLITGKEL